jgi:polyphosphate:AMP phosphotransferase
MFESAEIGHEIDKAKYARDVPRLRAALLEAQAELAEKADFPVIVLINGVDGAGKGETVNLLNEWMDPRNIETNALRSMNDDDRERPPMWRFWRQLPKSGKIGIFFGSWYSDPIVDRVFGKKKDAAFDRDIERITSFERGLAAEGALIVKFWFHLSKKKQKNRLIELEKNKATRWRVTSADWKNHRAYDRFVHVSEETIRRTSTDSAPWTILEGWDAHYRALTVGRALLAAMRLRLRGKPKSKKGARKDPLLPALDGKTLLTKGADHEPMPKKKYQNELEALQGALNILGRSPKFANRSCVIVFEGVDAAGKGGAIRRVSSALDARRYRISPIAAPTEDERSHPYLWRFWRRVPRPGDFAIFDRSWYGRVLVERVEGFCESDAWMRAYSEINDFEEQLTQNGAIVIKFWLQIEKGEQLRRFREREKTGFKRYKITADDWRNRKRWDDYTHAVSDMVDRTSTEASPWTVIEADDKYAARIHVLETITERLNKAL